MYSRKSGRIVRERRNTPFTHSGKRGRGLPEEYSMAEGWGHNTIIVLFAFILILAGCTNTSQLGKSEARNLEELGHPGTVVPKCEN